MEKVKRNDKINELINKMDTFEEMEYENSAYFDEEYAEMDISMEELFDMLEDNADRLDEVQKLIKDRQDGMKIQTRPDDKITPVDQTTLAPNALKNDIRKDQTEPNVLLKSNTDANSLTNDEVHNAVEIEAEKMIYTFLGVMFGAILIGALIGSICIFTCLKWHR